MKKLMIAAVAVVLMPIAVFGVKISGESRVSKVVVYNDRALVTREGVFDLSAGENTVLFTNIPNGIDDNSVRVSLAERGLRVLSIETGNFFTEKPLNAKIAELDDKILALNDAIKLLDDSTEVLRLKEEYLRQIKAYDPNIIIKDGQTLKQYGVKDWKEMCQFIEDTYTEIFKKKTEIGVERRKLTSQIQVCNSERNSLSSVEQKSYKSVSVTVDAPSKRSYRLFVSYISGGINWRPLFDARGLFDDKKVELTAYGVIAQSTGEDWNDVEVALSTARPALGGRAPALNASYLSFAAPYLRDSYKAEAKKTKLARSAPATEANLDDVAGMLAKDEELDRPAPVVAEIESGATAVFYNIKKHTDIPSDGRPHNVAISTDLFDTDFEYEAVPELSTTAYLKTSVKNGENSMLPGTANIFLENEYIGQSQFGKVLPGEKFDLYLGADEGIKIERKELKSEDDNTGFIFATTKRITKAYRITVTNMKSRQISLSINERVPVSKDEKIKVELVKCSPDRTGEMKDGILKWKLALKPGEKQVINIEYKIEYPKDRPVYYN